MGSWYGNGTVGSYEWFAGYPSNANFVAQFASRFDIPASGWITAMRAHVGGHDGTVTIGLAIWHADLGGLPDAVLWQSGTFQVGVGRAWQQVSVPAVRRAAGQYNYFGFFRNAYTPAIELSFGGSGTRYYDANGGGNAQTFSEDYTNLNGPGLLTVQFFLEPNAAPSTGAWTSAPSGTVTDSNPLFEGSIPHDNGDGAYDTTDAVHWQVWRVSDGQYVINGEFGSGTVTINNGTRRWSARPSTVGATLTAGVTYRSRFRHRDSWGVWSSFSAITEFQINAGPNPPTLTAPSGKINTLTPTYQGSYSHPNGLAADRIRVKLYSGTGVLLDTKEAAISVANGASWSIAHTTLALTALQWATAYKWTAAFRDTGGVWSSDAALKDFRTDAAPSTPTDLSPSGGAVVTGTVILRATVTDPDGDALTSLTWDLWNKTDNVQVTGYPVNVTGSWASGTTVSRDVTASLTLGKRYQWRVKAYDGTLEGPYTAWQEFLYSNAPSVTLTAPTNGATITNPAMSVTITYSGAAAKASDRTVIERQGSGGTWTTVYDSGYVSGSRTSWTIPVGVLLNTSTYRITVWAKDTNGLEGQATPAVFTTAWTPPPTPVLQVVSGDAAFAVINLAWEPTTLTATEFVAWEVVKVSAEEHDEETVALIRDPNATAFTYHFPVSGRAYVFKLRQWRIVGVEFVPSDFAESISLSVEYSTWWIKSVDDPVGLRVPFQVRVAQPSQMTGSADQAALRAWGARAPVHLIGEGRVRSGSLQITGWEGDGLPVSLADRLRRLRELDRLRGAVCLLTQHPPDKAFTMLATIRYQPDATFGEVVDVDWEETAYDEDVTARGEGL